MTLHLPPELFGAGFVPGEDLTSGGRGVKLVGKDWRRERPEAGAERRSHGARPAASVEVVPCRDALLQAWCPRDRTSGHVCARKYSATGRRPGDWASSSALHAPDSASPSINPEHAGRRPRRAEQSSPRSSPSRAGPRPRPASPAPSSSPRRGAAMPGRLLRGLRQRWRRYKYRFVPWIALNLNHNPR
jgi:hypothetical protein